MDELLARASIAGQHINVYTGTDYTAIEALRRQIIEQEKKSKSYHTAVDIAKSDHHDAHIKQTSAQREIVGLLERKSSWSPADLERYMNLVRSEHTNDQAVQTAKDTLAAAERDLEDARSLLERLERKQYHEEQVWSDTIRRNSTWVTFGLMGVNILLLLAQIAIFEPYRRQRIVRDVQHALDEKTRPLAETASLGRVAGDAVPDQHVDAKVSALADFVDKFASLSEDQLIQLTKDAIERFELEQASSSQPSDALAVSATSYGENAGSEPLVHEEATPGEVPGSPSGSHVIGTEYGSWSATVEACKASLQDLFSNRIIQMKKLDVTYTALQGAAVGGVLTGLVWAALRSQ